VSHISSGTASNNFALNNMTINGVVYSGVENDNNGINKSIEQFKVQETYSNATTFVSFIYNHKNNLFFICFIVFGYPITRV
jgi:hypothetical protein